MVGTRIGTDQNVHRATLTVGSSLFVCFISLSREIHFATKTNFIFLFFNNFHFLAAQEVFLLSYELNLFVLFQKLTQV